LLDEKHNKCEIRRRYMRRDENRTAGLSKQCEWKVEDELAETVKHHALENIKINELFEPACVAKGGKSDVELLKKLLDQGIISAITFEHFSH
jgi:hypothetical protein